MRVNRPGWTMAALLAAAAAGGVGLGSCKREAPKPASMNRAPRIAAPSTRDVQADLDQKRMAELVPIPDLGTGVNAKGPDGQIWVKYPSGIMIHELKPSDKRKPRWGQTVAINYVGRIPEGDKVFDKSPADHPFTFALGSKQIIMGMNMGVSTMGLEGKREIYIPAELAYGKGGVRESGIGPDQPLIFTLELVSITGDGLPMPAAPPAPGELPKPSTDNSMLMGPAAPPSATTTTKP